MFAGFGGYLVTRAFLALFGDSDLLPNILASHSHSLVNFVLLLTFYLVILMEWGYTWAVVNTHRKVLARNRGVRDEVQYLAPL